MKNFSRKEITVGVIVLVLFLASYVGIIFYADQEPFLNGVEVKTAAPASPDHVSIFVRTMSIDPVKGETVVRFQFEPKGALLSPDGVTLNQTIVMDVNAETGKAEYTYKKGERANPMDVTLGVYGLVNKYPFDSHQGELFVALTTPLPPAKDAPKDAPIEYGDVPFSIDYLGQMNGYNISGSEAQDKDPGTILINFQIQRSSTVIAFAVFIMALKWLLALSALFVALSVAVRGRKVELAMFSWLAALLFALPPLRNAMPAVPPLGSFNDFASFFWAEGIVALSLITIVFTWLKRAGAK